MEISVIRIYLLFGLLLHKAVWEVMKKRAPARPQQKNRSLKTRILSGIKVTILAAIIVQTVAPEILPISSDPAPLRIIGVAVYTLGLLTAVTARLQLGRNWSDIEKSYVKQDHELVAHGLYRYVRHPIYAGDLMLLLGLELALNSWAVAAVIALVLYVRQQAIREEGKLRETLPGYDEYCRRTTRFLPFLPV